MACMGLTAVASKARLGTSKHGVVSSLCMPMLSFTVSHMQCWFCPAFFLLQVALLGLSLSSAVQQPSRLAGGSTAAARPPQGSNAGGNLQGLQSPPLSAKPSPADPAGGPVAPAPGAAASSPRHPRASPHAHRAEETVDLQPALAGTIIGTGRSPRGVALVEPGLTAGGGAGGTSPYTKLPTSLVWQSKVQQPFALHIQATCRGQGRAVWAAAAAGCFVTFNSCC